MRFGHFTMIMGVVLVLSLAGCNRQQENINISSSPAINKGTTATTVLAKIVAGEKPLQPVPGDGAPESQDQPASIQVIFSESGRGVAYSAERGGKVYVVHNQRRGKEYASDGKSVAYGVKDAQALIWVVEKL